MGVWEVHCRDMAPLPATVPSPELAKPCTQTPVLTELAVLQGPGAGGSWDNPEDTHGSMVVSSSKKQQAGMTHKLTSLEPKASRSTTETERSESKDSAGCQLLLVQASFGGATVGVMHSGEPHIKASASL